MLPLRFFVLLQDSRLASQRCLAANLSSFVLSNSAPSRGVIVGGASVVSTCSSASTSNCQRISFYQQPQHQHQCQYLSLFPLYLSQIFQHVQSASCFHQPHLLEPYLLSFSLSVFKVASWYRKNSSSYIGSSYSLNVSRESTSSWPSSLTSFLSPSPTSLASVLLASPSGPSRPSVTV